MEGEWSAVTCVSLYMLLMGFSMKGIDALKRHQAELEMKFPDEDISVSEGFDDGEHGWPVLNRDMRLLWEQRRQH